MLARKGAANLRVIRRKLSFVYIHETLLYIYLVNRNDCRFLFIFYIPLIRFDYNEFNTKIRLGGALCIFPLLATIR